MESDHYKVLGVSREATDIEIKKTYRELLLKHHPDKGGDTAIFHKIRKAFEILGCVEKRKAYTRSLETNLDVDCKEDHKEDHKDDHKEDPRSNRKGDQKSPKSMDIHLHVVVTLDDLYHNKIYNITTTRHLHCLTCTGLGVIDYVIVPCLLCDGKGHYFTVVGITVVCEHCQGNGALPIEASPAICSKCRGQGYTQQSQHLRVPCFHIFRSPRCVIFYGQGHRLANGSGDLFVYFDEYRDNNNDDDESYFRQGTDLCYDKYITMFDMLYGFTFPLKTIDGRNLLLELQGLVGAPEQYDTVSENWFVKIVPNEGLPIPGQQIRGNLKVFLKLVVPDLLGDDSAKTMLKQLFLSSASSDLVVDKKTILLVNANVGAE